MMARKMVINFSVSILAMLWTVTNVFVFATSPCPNQGCEISLCPLGQTYCSACTARNCGTTCVTQTEAQSNYWGDIYADRGLQCTQSTPSVVCNYVYGCKVPTLTNDCVENQNDQKQTVYKFPYVPSAC